MLGLHLGLCLIAGREWLGMKVTQSVLAYWDQDNPDAWLTDNRICALRRGLGLDDSLPEAIVFRASRRIVGNPLLVTSLIEWLISMSVTVLIVDTLASVNPATERDPEMAVQTIGETFFPMVAHGITPIIFHHIGKDFIDAKGNPRRRKGLHAARGSSALAAAVGAAFNLDQDEHGKRQLECVKPRYGLAPTLSLDYDEDGHPGSDDWRVSITSPVKRLSHENLDSLVKASELQTCSSRQLVARLKDRGITISQSGAARCLSRVK